MEKARPTLLADVAIGLVAGLVATKVTGYAQEALYRPMPDRIKEREERVRPGDPPQLAAQKSAAALGLALSEEQLQRMAMAMAIHYASGLNPTFGAHVLRRR